MTLHRLRKACEPHTIRDSVQCLWGDRVALLHMHMHMHMVMSALVVEGDQSFGAVDGPRDITECSASLAHERIRTDTLRCDSAACSRRAHSLEEVRQRVS